MRKLFVSPVFMLLLLQVTCYSGTDSRSLALGGSYLAIGEGLSTLDSNPAGLYSKTKDTHKELRLLDFTISGDMINFLNKMVRISTTIAGVYQMQEDQGYLDLNGVLMFNDFMGNVEKMNESGTGFLTETSLGSIQLNMGNPAISITPRIFLGVEPMMDMNSLTSGTIKITTGTLNFDFSHVPATTTPPSASLIGARDNMTSFIDTLIAAGATTGPYSSQEVANSMINQAAGKGMSDTEIVLMSSNTAAFLPLFESMYMIMMSSSPETYLSYDFGFVMKDLNVAEFTLGFASDIKSFDGTFWDGFSIGVNLKYLMGEAIYKRVNIAEMQYYLKHSDYEILKADNSRKSNTFGVDVGVLFDKKLEWKTKFAMSLKDINTPKFEAPKSANGYNVKYEIPPSAKVGVAFWPVDRVTMALDADLLKNPTFLNNYYTQMVSFGIEGIVLDDLPNYNLTLRGGMNKNLASSRDSTNYSLGFGFTVMSVTIDMALAYSPTGVPYNQTPGYVNKYFKMLNFGYVPDTWQFAFGFSFRFK